jgi:ribonuclease BN (tRNA processing enzyme)
MTWLSGRKVSTLAIATGLALAGCHRGSEAQQAAPSKLAAASRPNGSQWVELGTQSGPVPSGVRSEPAHLLRYKDQAVLVDVGDGATEQMAKAGVLPADVHTVFISHLHFDHTGGLFGFLGMRFQGSRADTPVTIYGPPGTKALVVGLRSAMQNGAALAPLPPPTYTVIELGDGSKVTVGDIKVTVAANSHYIAWPGTGPKPVALSYRFDLPDRSIAYTGDTGPSPKVEALAKDVDLLVSEIMDVDSAMTRLKLDQPDVPPPIRLYIRTHFQKEHLEADQVGLLAQRAGAKSLVLTHFGGANGEQSQIDRLTKEIAANYKGPITFANDLDKF